MEALDQILTSLEKSASTQFASTTLTYFKLSTQNNNNNNNNYNNNNNNNGTAIDRNTEQWVMFQTMRSCQLEMDIATELNDMKEQIAQTIRLAEVYSENKYCGEAYEMLIRAKKNMEQRLTISSMDPHAEYLLIKIMFLLGVVIITHMKRHDDGMEFIDSAYNRGDELVRCICPANIDVRTQSSLIYDSKLLLSEILLYKASTAIQRNRSNDSMVASKIISTTLIETLRTIVGNSGDSCLIVNANILRLTLLDVTSCLICMKEYVTAQRCLNYVNTMMNTDSEVSEESQVKRLAQMMETVEKVMEQERLAAEAANVAKKEPAPAPTTTPAKSIMGTESDDDDSDGWPSSDEDERPSTGLSLSLGRNAKVTFDDDDDDDESDDWPSSDEGSDRKAPFAGLIDNSDDELEESTDDVAHEELFPNRYRFFKSREFETLDNSPSTEPSCLLTLKTEDGGESFKDAGELKRWLQSIVSKHTKSLDQSKVDEENEVHNEVSLVESFQTNLKYMDIFSKRWAREYFTTCWTLYYMNNREAHIQCWKLLVDYFNQLPNAKITKNLDQSDVQRLATIFNISIQLLHIAALLWSPDLVNAFRSMMDSVNQFYPRQSDAVTLVEMKALCHHIRTVALSTRRQEMSRIVPTLIQIFEKHNKKANTVPTPTTPIVGNSKTHLKKLASSVELACEALLIFHYYMCNMSPITLSPLLSDDDNIILTICDEEMQNHELFNLWNRFAQLENLYCKLNYYSMLKALTILALGQCCKHFNEDGKAEMAFFEALLIIDKTSPFALGVPSIKCDYGTRALIEYASSVLANNKYPFASLAFYAAVKNYKSMNKDYDYMLISELAEISSKNDDWKRSCYYLRKLLKYNMRLGGEFNIPKVVYLGEKLCEEYMERGDFRNAEHYIISAVSFVKSAGRDKGISSSINSDFSTRTGETELNLQLKLAHLFLQGYYFERGIDLLARIIEEKLTQMQRCLVLTNLAEAYLKKRWLKECEFVLNKLAPLLEPHILGDVVNEVKILEIAARCYFRKAKYELALFCVNAALQRCSIPGRLATLFFLKAKIFQQMCHSKTPLSFPVNVTVDRATLEKDEGNLFHQFYKDEDAQITHYGASLRRNALLFAQREIYQEASQLLQDSIYCFGKAIYYYTAVSDEISIAKVKLEIAKVQLEYLFSDIAFLDADPATSSQLPSTANTESRMESHSFTHDFIGLANIESEYICPALDTAVRTTHVMLSLDSYITMSECRYLQGRYLASQSFWTECRDVLFTLFMDESEVVVSKGSPPGFLERLMAIVTRLVRLLFCYEPDFINRNLAVVDALLLLEIELEQVLKRSGESSTEATFVSTDSGNDSPSDNESGDENSLIAQNKIYQSLPCNSSVSRGKSLPFLRRSSKKRSAKMTAFRARKPTTGSSLRGSQSSSSSKLDGYMDAVYMTERVTERVWSCFYRMKQHSRKYSAQTMSEPDLCFKNQQSMRRLYNLMLAIRGKKLTTRSPTNSNNGHNSTNEFKRASKASRNSERTENNNSQSSTTPLEETVVDQIDKKIGHMSLTSGDLMLVNCFLRTLGTEEDRKRFQSLSASPVDTEDNLKFENNHARQESLPADVSMIESSDRVNPKLLSRLVYILSVDQVIIHYIPSTGLKNFLQFGGRKDGKCVVPDRYFDSTLASGTSMLKMSGTLINETSKTFSGTKKATNATSSVSVKEQANKYLFDQLDQYINALLTQAKKEKRPTGVDQTDAIVDLVQTGLFSKLPFGYSPRQNAPPNLTSKKIDYKNLFGKKKFKFIASTKNITGMIPKLDELTITDQPLLLLCSHSLHIIPWELMFAELMTRAFSLQNVTKQKQNRDRYVPAYFSFYSEDESKYIAPIEKKRKDWLYFYLRKKLGFGQNDPGIFHDSLPNLPLHSPLIHYGKRPSKSKRFKEINFVKLSAISENPTQIITHIESFLNTPQYPVFLFTLADLIDLSEAILCILSYRPDCTLLFVAEGMIGQAAELLLEMQNMYTKTGQLTNSKNPTMTTYKFFAHCINILHKELKIPAVVINPPLP